MSETTELLRRIDETSQRMLEVLADISLTLKQPELDGAPRGNPEDYLEEPIFGEIPFRAVSALAAKGVHTFGDLVKLSENEVQALSGIGVVAYRKIARALFWRGLKLMDNSEG